MTLETRSVALGRDGEPSATRTKGRVRRVFAGALVLLSCSCGPLGVARSRHGVAALDVGHAPSRIFFGSCLRQNLPQPIWSAVLARHPDLALLLGDNVYADTPDDPAVLVAAYAQQLANPGLARLRATTPLLVTWDDHDYGWKDAGREYPLRAASKRLFLDAWQEPATSARRTHEGVYDAVVLGSHDRSIQVILLDTRSFRTALVRDPLWANTGDGLGPYRPTASLDATLLGDEQWRWLAAQLRRPARLRIVASSIQMVAAQHGGEDWRNFPAEYERFLDLLQEAHATGVLVVSGDRHMAELSRASTRSGWPLYDLTSSSLNSPQPHPHPAPNDLRVGTVVTDANFGEIAIDWHTPDPRITLRIVDPSGAIRLEQWTRASELGS